MHVIRKYSAKPQGICTYFIQYLAASSTEFSYEGSEETEQDRGSVAEWESWRVEPQCRTAALVPLPVESLVF